MGPKENTEERDERPADKEKEVKQGKEGDSDYESARDSLSSQGDNSNGNGNGDSNGSGNGNGDSNGSGNGNGDSNGSGNGNGDSNGSGNGNGDNKVKRAQRLPKKLIQKQSAESGPRAPKGNSDHRDSSKLQVKALNTGQSSHQKPKRPGSTRTIVNNKKSDGTGVPSEPPSGLSEGSDEKTEINVIDDSPVGDRSTGTDDEIDDKGETIPADDPVNAYQKIEELEQRIDRLEEELREVAALEISLYSVVPEHGGSANKVYTPARRLSRLYLHACKYWTQDKRATVARNTVSGLELIAKSCGHDVPRLTFWLSNTIVLRDIICQTFGHKSLSVVESNDEARKAEGIPSPLRLREDDGTKQMKTSSLLQPFEDWQEPGTFITALEKIESWVFSRTVESVWWQSFNPHMHSSTEDFHSKENLGSLSELTTDGQLQARFSVHVWKKAFHDAFARICPLRAGGHECGCLVILAKMVMEQCVSRLDVAMFNAILRMSEDEVPTDPVSDPIVDEKVLPIPIGDLTFKSGSLLKNSLGDLSRLLTKLFDIDVEDTTNYDQNVDGRRGCAKPKSFLLLNELSGLLMVPKDLLDKDAINNEVCPTLGMPTVLRVLCHFAPDEYSPYPVPVTLLEALKPEISSELHSTEHDVFPRSAAPIVYSAPSSTDAAKAAKVGREGELERTVSMALKKGYTSDEELDDLESPLKSITDKTQAASSPKVVADTQAESVWANARFKLLRKVWSEIV